MNQPDIIFFMVDQLGAKWLDSALNGACPLPNIARLRARGTSFSNAISSNPICCPTRATIATGLNSHGHGVIENGYQLDPQLPTFMRALQGASWRTGAFGKVHFQPHFRGLHPDYREYGFDVTHVTEDGRGGQWLDWIIEAHPQHLNAVLATIWAYPIPEFAAYGPDEIDLQTRIKKLRQTFDWATPDFPCNSIAAYTLPFPEAVSQTNWITGHALDFLRDTPREQPIFAHISYVQPHSPFCAPQSDMASVDCGQIPAPIAADWDDPTLPHYLRSLRAKTRADTAHARHLYFADLIHLDRQLGAVMDALETSERADNAYIFFLSDHGEMLGDHGMWGKESRHYDACLRVPLTIVGPSLAAGEICDAAVQLEDICPTILDMPDRNCRRCRVWGRIFGMKISPFRQAIRCYRCAVIPTRHGRARRLIAKATTRFGRTRWTNGRAPSARATIVTLSTPMAAASSFSICVAIPTSRIMWRLTPLIATCARVCAASCWSLSWRRNIPKRAANCSPWACIKARFNSPATRRERSCLVPRPIRLRRGHRDFRRCV